VYYKCVKFHKNPISRLGGVALTRYMVGQTDAQTDGRTNRVIPIYPPLCLRGYKYKRLNATLCFHLRIEKLEKKNKFESQHFIWTQHCFIKKKNKKNLAVHIITDINYYENSTKGSKLRIINNNQINSTIIDTNDHGSDLSGCNILIIIFCH
jgi:hypothetical protein